MPIDDDFSNPNPAPESKPALVQSGDDIAVAFNFQDAFDRLYEEKASKGNILPSSNDEDEGITREVLIRRERRLLRVPFAPSLLAFLFSGRSKMEIVCGVPNDVLIIDVSGLDFATRCIHVIIGHESFESIPWGHIVPVLSRGIVVVKMVDPGEEKK